jgi:hypothetical protein
VDCCVLAPPLSLSTVLDGSVPLPHAASMTAINGTAR